MAGCNPEGVGKKVSVPNGLADTLLSLHSDVERQLSSSLFPSNTTPVPPSHDELSLGGCPVRVLNEKRKLFKGVVSDLRSKPTCISYTISSSVSLSCILLCVLGASVFTMTKTPFGGLQNISQKRICSPSKTYGVFTIAPD